MKFRDVIKNTPWEKVERYLLEATPNSNTPSYKDAYSVLQSRDAKPNEMRIVIKVLELEGPDEPSENEMHGANGTHRCDSEVYDSEGIETPESPDQELWIGLDLTPLDEWLGTEVDPVHRQQFEPAELIANQLRKLPFHSFKPSEIQAFFERLEDRSQAIQTMISDERQACSLNLEDANALIAEVEGLSGMGIDAVQDNKNGERLVRKSKK